MLTAHCCNATFHVAMHPRAHIFALSGRINRFSRHLGSGKGALDMIRNFLAYANDRITKRRQFNRLADEIASLSSRDLADLRADRGEMLRHAYQKIYG
jgi:hypothetical protein